VTAQSLDSFKCRAELEVGGRTYHYFDLEAAERNGLEGVSRLPFSLKVLLENLLRSEDGRTVKTPISPDVGSRATIEYVATGRRNGGGAGRTGSSVIRSLEREFLSGASREIGQY
jgi:hypothetical protein